MAEEEPTPCSSHLRPLTNYCIDCRKLICHKCSGCIKHHLISIRTYIDNNKDKVAQHLFSENYDRTLEQAIEETKLDIDKINCSLHRYESRVIEADSLISRSKQRLKSDLGLVAKTIGHIRKVCEKASTDVLRDTCQRGVELFDIDEKVQNEIERFQSRLFRLVKRQLTWKSELDELQLNIQYLNAIRSARQKNTVGDRETIATLTLLERGVLVERACVNTTVDKFCAFTGANTLPEIEEAMSRQMNSVGSRLRVSDPVPFYRNIGGSKHSTASVSHDGVIAVYSRLDFDGMSLTNLRTNLRCDFKVEGVSLAGFYDDRLLVLTDGMPLRGCKVSEIFAVPSVSVLVAVPKTGSVSHRADVTVLDSVRTLFFIKDECKLRAYNVDTKLVKKIPHGGKVWSLPSSTGIDMGIRFVFQKAGENKDIFFTGLDYNQRFLARYEPMFHVTTVIPSSLSNSVGRAVKLHSNRKFYVGDEEGTFINSPLQYDGSYSVVRLYRDIFIAYECKSKRWVLVRIDVM